MAKCRFVVLLKDHSKREALRDREYPQSPVYIYEFPVTGQDLMETGEFVQKRVGDYLRASRLPDDGIPACTAEERWASPDKWAVMKKGRKSAVRVLDSEEEAVAKAAALGSGHCVEFRKGESRKCAGYCACREFCNFYRESCMEEKGGEE